MGRIAKIEHVQTRRALSNFIAIAAQINSQKVPDEQAIRRLVRYDRDLLVGTLTKAGLTRFAPAEGAFYLYVDVSALTGDSQAFCRRMLDETGVAVHAQQLTLDLAATSFLGAEIGPEAILAPDDHLYCYGTACADQAFVSHATALKRVA